MLYTPGVERRNQRGKKDVKEAKHVYDDVKQILESESKVCEGLKMGVEVQFGATLEEMKTLWK